MMKRLGLFVAVNLLVLITISLTLAVIFYLFNLQPYFNKIGIDYPLLLIFCAIAGFTGSIISLLFSRWMAKVMLGVKVIKSPPPKSDEAFLLKTVQRFMPDCGISVMPEVGIYASQEINAFATGPTKNRALVAVSSALLRQLDKNAMEGVVAHEMAHISNGDMITMTLIQGIVNTFVMFFSRVAAWVVVSIFRKRRDDEDSPPPFFLVYILTFIFEIFLSILGSIVVASFSRKREFIADEGGASLAGTHKMIHALESLRNTLDKLDEKNPSFATFKISGKSSRLLKLFATHPDLEERIARLKLLE